MDPREPKQDRQNPERKAGERDEREVPRRTPGMAEGDEGKPRQMPQPEPGKTPGSAEG